MRTTTTNEASYGFNPSTGFHPEVKELLVASMGSETTTICEQALATPCTVQHLRASCIHVDLDDDSIPIPSTTSSARVPLKTLLDEIRAALNSPARVEQHPLIRQSIAISSASSPSSSSSSALEYAQTLPSPVKEVFVGRKCAEAVLKGADVFAPGVLAMTQGVIPGDTVVILGVVEDPKTGEYPVPRGTTLDHNNNNNNNNNNGTLPPPPSWAETARRRLFLGVGVAELSRVDVFRDSRGRAVRLTHRLFPNPTLHGVGLGLVMPQSLPSTVAACVLLDDKEEEEEEEEEASTTRSSRDVKVLDMCACPGGKTTAIAEILEDRKRRRSRRRRRILPNKNEEEEDEDDGRIMVYALDRTHTKAKRIQDLCEELGVTSVKALKMDATKSVRLDSPPSSPTSPTPTPTTTTTTTSDKELRRLERKRKGAELRGMPTPKNTTQVTNRTTQHEQGGFHKESFDYILLDAPCSAMGLRPRLVQEATLESLRQAAVYQRIFIRQAVQLLKPGGRLVVSTCTINPWENEANVRWTLDHFPELRLGDARSSRVRVGGPGLTGGPPLEENTTTPTTTTTTWLTQEEAEKVQRFTPLAPSDAPGFFIALYTKE